MATGLSEKELLAIFTKQLRDSDDDEAHRIRDNMARIQAKGEKRQKRLRPHEPVDRMSALEKQFLYYWRLCGGENTDWLYGQHPFPERPRMHVDFTLVSDPKIVVEVDGGQWSQEKKGRKSGHNSGTGIQRDAEKLMLCNRYGMTLYRLPTSMVDYDNVMTIFEAVNNGTTTTDTTA